MVKIGDVVIIYIDNQKAEYNVSYADEDTIQIYEPSNPSHLSGLVKDTFGNWKIYGLPHTTKQYIFFPSNATPTTESSSFDDQEADDYPEEQPSYPPTTTNLQTSYPQPANYLPQASFCAPVSCAPIPFAPISCAVAQTSYGEHRSYGMPNGYPPPQSYIPQVTNTSPASFMQNSVPKNFYTSTRNYGSDGALGSRREPYDFDSRADPYSMQSEAELLESVKEIYDKKVVDLPPEPKKKKVKKVKEGSIDTTEPDWYKNASRSLNNGIKLERKTKT